jgi:hypothetical protein
VPLPLEVLQFEPMASGHRSLRLTTLVSWEAFTDYAEDVVSSLGGTVDGRVDSPVERVWDVTIDGGRFWLRSTTSASGCRSTRATRGRTR